MAILDEELRQDAQEDAAAITAIRSRLSQEQQAVCTEELLQQIIDWMVEFLADSDLLDEDADENGEVDINLELIAAEVQKHAAECGMAVPDSDCLQQIADAWLDFEAEYNG